jgi:hypothetical protein
VLAAVATVANDGGTMPTLLTTTGGGAGAVVMDAGLPTLLTTTGGGAGAVAVVAGVPMDFDVAFAFGGGVVSTYLEFTTGTRMVRVPGCVALGCGTSSRTRRAGTIRSR